MPPEQTPSAPMRSRRWRTVPLRELGLKLRAHVWYLQPLRRERLGVRPDGSPLWLVLEGASLIRAQTPRRASLRPAQQQRPPSPASVARALAVVEHATQTAVAICEAIDAGRSPLPVALGAWAEHLRLAMLPRERPTRTRIPAPSPGAPPTLVNATSGGRGCWTFELPAVQIRRRTRDPSHKPHPPTADLHLLRGGTWALNPWRP